MLCVVMLIFTCAYTHTHTLVVAQSNSSFYNSGLPHLQLYCIRQRALRSVIAKHVCRSHTATEVTLMYLSVVSKHCM